MNTQTLLSDIPLGTAQSAFNGVSMDPEKRAHTAQSDYANTLAEDYQTLLKIVADKPELQTTMEQEFARYREGYRKRFMAYLHSSSRCVSSFIAGPSNFPVARMNKRADIAHRRMTEFLEFRKRAMDAITKTLCPELRPIMAGDSDACQRLQADIAEAEALQARMKAANTTIRQFLKDHHNGRLALEQQGFTAGQAQRLFEPDCFGGLGFASFELTNNGANIRRMKLRLETISNAKALPEVEIQGDNARFEDCPADNRVRLFFPGKPSAEVRTRLKSSGFRWSPTIGAWQAYRHNHTIAIAKQEAGLQQAA